MREYKLALIGFGNVGQGFTQILGERGEALARQFGAHFTIVAVSDLLLGSVYSPWGLKPVELLKAAREGSLESVTGEHHNWDALETIQESNANTVLELSYTDLKSGQPAISHVEMALKMGKHVVTTNKGPIALRYNELLELARLHEVEIGVEGTVMSGTPVIHLGMEFLSAAGIHKVQGIFNGTTNYILTQMSKGIEYIEALKQAQVLGFAEADPTSDVEGYDAAGKVVILANLIMDTPLVLGDVARQGITQLTLDSIREANQVGECWKLIGMVEKNNGSVHASVRPTRLPLSHPLASVNGATNAITYSTSVLGDITLIGPGAGRMETGYALLEDLLAIHRRRIV
jgi:homoserine dehydrogenase